MSILELRILPPLAIARLGSSSEPLENYELVIDDPLGRRIIEPAETLRVDPASGEVVEAYPPARPVRFRDGPHIRPVAPFLEVFARTDAETLAPLTIDLLAAEGLTASDLKWTVEVGNLKAFRRTGAADDRILAKATFSDHEPHALEGQCQNFRPGKSLPLGSVRYLRPNKDFPEIRLRFTPAAGLVYGADTQRIDGDRGEWPGLGRRPDRERQSRSTIRRSRTPSGKAGPIPASRPTPIPGQIYAGYDSPDGAHVSWGYLDDECDGIASVELKVGDVTLRAFGRLGAGPPAFAPDGLPIRTVADEIDQAMFGPEVSGPDVSADRVEDIVRRAFETVRLLNTAVLNGNPVDGRLGTESMMPLQDFERLPPDVCADHGDEPGGQPFCCRTTPDDPDGSEERHSGVVRGRAPPSGGGRRPFGQRPAQNAGHDARRRRALPDAHAATNRHDSEIHRARSVFVTGGRHG